MYIVRGETKDGFGPIYWTGVALSRLPNQAFKCNSREFAELSCEHCNADHIAFTFWIEEVPSQ